MASITGTCLQSIVYTEQSIDTFYGLTKFKYTMIALGFKVTSTCYMFDKLPVTED